MMISDLALIPIVPSPADIWAAAAAKRLAEAALPVNDTLVTRMVANMVQGSTALAKDMLELLAEDQDHPLLMSTLGSRTAFRDAQIMGATVHAVPRANTAVNELEAMTTEVLGLIGLEARGGQ